MTKETFDPIVQHIKEWENCRDKYRKLYVDTEESIYDARYMACRRLLGEEDKSLKYQHFQ